MTIDERQEELISQFELVDDWMDRYQMIIDLGDQLEPVDDTEHTSENLIDGCQSRVWIIISPQEDGTLPVSYTHLDVYKRQERTS